LAAEPQFFSQKIRERRAFSPISSGFAALVHGFATTTKALARIPASYAGYHLPFTDYRRGGVGVFGSAGFCG